MNQDGVTTNKECTTCKPSVDSKAARDIVSNYNCDDIYKKVDSCMLKHKGNISDCVEEWKEFKQCHDSRRSKDV